MNFCGICYTEGKECCRHRDVIVTNGDLDRIMKFTNRSDFVENRISRYPHSAQYNFEDPTWHRYTLNEDNTRRVLKNSKDDNCVFLSNEGCTLPMNVRPLLCRLHPYMYSEHQILFIDDDCPITNFDDPYKALEKMGMGYDAAEQWRRQLYQELKQDYLIKHQKS